MSLSRCSSALLMLCLSVGVVSANDFSFTGTFSQDDQLEMFLFTAPTANTVVRTWGYAGGLNSAGQTIFAGGFDPILSVFDATGGLVASSLLVANNNDGPTCPTGAPLCVSPDSTTGNPWDSLIVLPGLNPGGQYVLVLSQDDNVANGPNFGGGFSQTGFGDFTPSEFPCGAAAFCDASLSPRTGDWAVDILGVGTAADTSAPSVPEPASVLLFVTGLGSVALLRRRKQA